MDPDMAMEVFKEKQGIESFASGGFADMLEKLKDKIKDLKFDQEESDKISEKLSQFEEMTDIQGLTSGGIGPLNRPNIPSITRMADGGISELDNELKKLIDTFPGLSGGDRELQKAILDLQRAQQYTPDSAQYIDESSPLKAIYRPYYSEVTKAYNVGRPGKFDPMAAAPEERVQFNLKPRRIAGQLYAADGMMVDGQMFPDRDDLVTGPGGERDDKIPAMLSDGEFITNAKAVRGIGALAGAPADDPFAQRMEGAKQMYALQKAAEGYMGSMS
tara:strand:+ start:1 stop:822 length:822 start_codon:yes stop_codon:yes gene_type:complete